ncbi:MAG: sigma-70 family RNA polymerase sigma factor, partial [Clostridia bacterium]|nr:sigma-70 family RNA polymerase sigma factor [Clostridia bacterium]
MGRKRRPIRMNKTIEERNRFVEENIATLYWLRGKFKRRFHTLIAARVLSEEDIDSICALGVVKAASHYDAERGAKFPSFAYRIANQIMQIEIDARNRDMLCHAVSLDWEYEAGRDADDIITLMELVSDPEALYQLDDVLEDEGKKQLVARLQSLIETDPRAVEILRLKAQGKSYREAGEALGISFQRAQQIVKRLRERAEGIREKHGF